MQIDDRVIKMSNKFRLWFIFFLLVLTILQLTINENITNGTISISDSNRTFWGKYRETDYLLKPSSSVEYLESRANGGTVQTYYGTYINTSVCFFSDKEFRGTYEGYSLINQEQNQAAHLDMKGYLLLSESKSVVSLNGKIYSHFSKTECGNYNGGYPTQNDIFNANIGDSWVYSREERYYEDGQYNETSIAKYEIIVKDFPTKVVSASAFSTVHTEGTIWINDTLSTKYDKWTRLTNGKSIAYEQYYWEADKWTISSKTELVSETDSSIILPADNSVYFGIVILALALPLASFLVYRIFNKNSVHLRQERERVHKEQLEHERLEKERVEREQRDKEHQERARQEQNYAQNRQNSVPSTLSDLFEVLVVPANASKSQVRAAFLKLTLDWHPDKFEKHGDPKIMELANENYIRIKKAYEEIYRRKGWT